MTRFVSVTGTGPIGTDKGPAIHMSAAMIPHIAISYVAIFLIMSNLPVGVSSCRHTDRRTKITTALSAADLKTSPPQIVNRPSCPVNQVRIAHTKKNVNPKQSQLTFFLLLPSFLQQAPLLICLWQSSI